MPAPTIRQMIETTSGLLSGPSGQMTIIIAASAPMKPATEPTLRSIWPDTMTSSMVAQSDAIAPVSVQVAKFIQNPDGLAGAIDVVQTEFDIEVRPYSLITVKNRVLSPAAKMLHDFILREVG